MEYNMMEWDLYTADKIVEQSMDPENEENPNVASVTYSNRSEKWRYYLTIDKWVFED